jgi:hypothetical protein
MLLPWVQDLEALEAINQDEDIRRIVLRMATLARGGRLGSFIAAVDADAELDAQTKESVLELAHDETFLLAAEEYLQRCRHYH